MICVWSGFHARNAAGRARTDALEAQIVDTSINLIVEYKPVESKTRTYHGRVGSGRPAERPSGVGQDWVPTQLFAQETNVYHILQGIEETSLQRLSRSTNKRNPM